MGTPSGATVDGFVAGAPDTIVTGVVITFLASQAVLERAAVLGSNLVITHEGIDYSHHSNASWLRDEDPVWSAKQAFIADAGIVVYRYHDGIHRRRPDEITAGLVEALGWESSVEDIRPEASIVRLPPIKLRTLAGILKEKLGLPYVRVAGDLAASCERIGVTVGYRGGGAVAIPLLREVDVVIAGEGPEWETPEYVRDAMHRGRKKAFLLIGHAASEEPGMRRLTARLQADCPDVPVRFVSGPQTLQLL
ncbi:transcriptional regulator [Paenibacillus antri]|uniref:GTP cyclohydrolase 1 type 2 homolog n=1 Tax=Paenibacillus antri TaxID=2582848 RepID=A0A5R9G4M8_9BACL|nr:Nif3-like dinuclear metal center hexameric protein [Paenibacillus antri]TLS49090.1 transcriptional regulator [Paenibacillus antri]